MDEARADDAREARAGGADGARAGGADAARAGGARAAGASWAAGPSWAARADEARTGEPRPGGAARPGAPSRAGRLARAAGWIGAGVLLAGAGAGVTAVGTGAPGLETVTFTRISCAETRTAEGGGVWHCFGMSAAQIAAAEEDRRRAALDALRGRPSGPPPVRSTRLSFVAHDGRKDPAEVTATRVGSRWIAHAPGVVGTGAALLLGGCGALAAGLAGLRAARGVSQISR
ncbi:hypothetical protein ACF1BN_32540 [Streptomyces sp. NPDC014861]|uniref:hypothetical protein n=1 Tax=Streptomyces sp. NPDC014861 TaxID=3364923 RepID=UPI0036F9B9B7